MRYAHKILVIFFIFAFISCSKDKTYVNKSYKVEGYIYSSKTMIPTPNVKVSLTQTLNEYSLNDPTSITDSNGYFSLIYVANTDNSGVHLYKTLDDYNCVLHEIAIRKYLEKGKNVKLGKIYTSRFQ